MAQDSFANLRVGDHGRPEEQSVWPPFADIMSVVVMIFLIALVLFVVRNVDLMRQMRASMEAEREASEIARVTEIQRESLASRVDEMEELVSQLRLQLMGAQEQRDRVSTQLSQTQTRVTSLQSEKENLLREREDLQRLREQLAAEKLELSREVDSLNVTRATLEADKASLEDRYEQLKQALATMQLAFVEKDSEIARLQVEASSGRQALQLLQGDFSLLKERYDRLVRPARTAQGKYVVEIRYSKPAGETLIQLRGPAETVFRNVTADELRSELDRLKTDNPDRLYTKIIIPEDSGLSYNDAWAFTNDILSRYDYYYQ